MSPRVCGHVYSLRWKPPRAQGTTNDLRIRRRPHGRQGAHDETAIALRHHAWIEDRDDTPVVGRAQKAPHALGHHERRVRERDGYEAVAATAFHVHGSGAGHGIVGARERNLVDDDESTGLPGDVDTLPQGHRAHEAGVAFLPEALDQLSQRFFALQVDGQVRTLTQGLRSGHRPALRREEGKHPSARGLREFDEFVEQFLAGTVAPGQGQVGRHVADALARMVEG